MSTETKGRVMLVDGMALLFRAFYATSYGGYIRKTKAGLPTNAVYGFLQYFFDAVSTYEPSHVVCCWDMGKGTFRTEKYSGYKSNRIEAPLELVPQFELVKEVVSELGVPNIGLVGYEADDCIGTLASCFSEESEVYILTGDHDMLQLVNERVKVVIMKKGRSNYKVYDPAVLLEEKGLTAPQVIDLKGFMGDTSDNYPGVRGIGEKTALKLLADHGTIDGVIANLHLLPKGVRAKIEADLDMLHLSRELAEIRCDVPVVCTLADSLWQLQRENAARKFHELEFGSLMHLIAEAEEELGIVQIELGDLG
ncbi:5'-3' exonuclease [Paenibacillus donghaensis]|uniref:5'-3' exonuclease n=1 Tax=Paenibacillus donghaensis TaxID=414771 RepID=A0A2Z2KGS0_9BACL|nr:5'-3' exonuclease H3TH domain-containing protein [Paenibacillus donghaensis]ASA20022.1 flap endonuclease [Paenibacillus donghaensis]